MAESQSNDLQQKVAEFTRLYVNEQTGIVKVDLASEDSPKLSVWVSNWSAMEKVPDVNDFQGIKLIWGYHIPDGVAIVGGGILVNPDEPGPPIRRNHSDECKCAKCAQANAAMAKANASEEAGRNGIARRQMAKAIELLEGFRPSNNDMAEAYRAMSFIVLFSKARSKAKRKQNGIDAAAWYEKAIKVWEKNGNTEELGGNLTNLGSLYYRIGDYETALARCLRGLEMEKAKTTLGEESVAPFNHVAGCYLQLGRLDEAEATIRDGFARIGDSSESAGYLWSTLSKIAEARGEQHRQLAEQYRQRAEELLPPESCSLR